MKNMKGKWHDDVQFVKTKYLSRDIKKTAEYDLNIKAVL